MKKVNLTSWEMLLAAQAGVMRQVENLKIGRSAAHGAGDKNDWQLHIEGALGEYALAKHLGIFWDGKGKLRAPDVGEMDVRTRSEHSYDLILHESDPDDRIFWLVTGKNGDYAIRGKIVGRDGKRPEYWKDPAGGRPAYFVPPSKLEDA